MERFALNDHAIKGLNDDFAAHLFDHTHDSKLRAHSLATAGGCSHQNIVR